MGFKLERAPAPTEGFTLIRNGFHRDPGLSSNAHRIGCVLLSHGPEFVLTTKRLGEQVGISEKTAAAALSELEANRYLVRPTKRTVRSTHQLYVISDDKLTEADVAATRARLDAYRSDRRNDGEVRSPDRKNDGDLTAESTVNLTVKSAVNKKTNLLEDQVEKAHPRQPTALSPDWKPNREHRDVAKGRGLDLKAVEAKFSSYAAEHDWRLKDWDARFTQWLHEERPAPVRPRLIAGGLYQE